VTWLLNGDLHCSTCPAQFGYGGPHAIVLNAARAHGWHCFAGMSLSLKPLESHLCPDCIGTARAALKKSGPMDEDVPLFEVRAEIQRVIDARTPASTKKGHYPA
jgi:uncharacterized protein CbrC (UPF0167 family)